ncbi:MAG TPA: sugar ABC transporter substrate-binding protein, partial [Microterricola sp.]
IQLLKGETPKVEKTLDDGTPYVAVTPVLVGPADVQTVIDNGEASADDICTGEVLAACEANGVK